MVATPAHPLVPDHPLLRDRTRLEALLNVMYAQIQKILCPGGTRTTRHGARAGSGIERTVAGGIGPDDVLQEALLALLAFEPERLVSTWEALAVRIAQNKAKQALRTATKGRRRSGGAGGADEAVGGHGTVSAQGAGEDRAWEVGLLPLPDGDDPATEAYLANNVDVESELVETRQQLILMRLASELLSDRERRVFFDIHYLGVPRAEVGRQIGLTGQRIGQIYRRVAERLLAAANRDPEFRALSVIDSTDAARTTEPLTPPIPPSQGEETR